MTRRERLERKIERRREWADKAAARSNARFAAVSRIADAIPFGQPILVGHHSERRARKDVDRIHTGMTAACADADKARTHEAKASGLEAQLERAVFSDDDNAIEALEARIKEREADIEHDKAINKAWRKGGRDEVARLFGDALADTLAHTMKLCPYLKSPCSTTNTAASIRRDRERIEVIKRDQAKRAEAEEAPGGVLVEESKACPGYTTVRFAEKPDYSVIKALKAAGYRWGGGSWFGRTDALPTCVADLVLGVTGELDDAAAKLVADFGAEEG